MFKWLLPSLALLLWVLNAILVVLAVINLGLRSPEHLVAGGIVGAVMGLTLAIGGWVMLRRWRKRPISGGLKIAGVIVGLLWAALALYGLIINADGLYLSAIPFLLGLLFLWSALKQAEAKAT